MDGWTIGLFEQMKATDILLALFSFMLVCVGRGQRDVMSTQADITKQQAEISDQMRTNAYWPHLVIRDLQFRTLRSTRTSDEAPDAEYRIHMIGDKPVTLVAYQDELSWSDRPPSLDEIVGWKRTHLILDPDGSLPEENRVEDFDDVRQREMTGFDHRTRDWKFYLVVRTVCEDAFEQQHEHAWCFYWASMQNGGEWPRSVA